MKNFKLWNTLCGWLVFAVAAATYLLTIEPTASFWDCGEFISSAWKLDVGHPPGAPFFMLMGHFFALFASDASHVAMCVNALSALASAFTILFLFWTITALAKKLVQPDTLWKGIALVLLAHWHIPLATRSGSPLSRARYMRPRRSLRLWYSGSFSNGTNRLMKRVVTAGSSPSLT